MTTQEETAKYSEDSVEFDIWQYLLVIRRNWLPASLTFLACLLGSGFAAVYTHRPVYEATGQLLFQNQDPSSELTGVGTEVGKLDSVGRSNPLETQAKLLQSRALLSDVIQKLDLRNDLGAFISPDLVRRGLIVRQVPNTDILSVSYQSPDQDFPADFVNQLMRSYVEFNTQLQQSETLAARKFVETQLPQLRESFDQASRELEEFKIKNNIISLDSEAKEIAGLIAGFNQEKGELNVQLAAALARASDIGRQLQVDADSALALSALNDSSGVQDVLSQIQTVEAELAAQRALYLPDHPTIVNLQRQADTLNSLLQERIAAVLGSSAQVTPANLQLGSLKEELISEFVKAKSDALVLQAQLGALQTLEASYRARANAFPLLEKEQRDLEQKLDSSQSRYNQFLERLQELNLTGNQLQASNQVQIIEEAVRPDWSLTSFNEKLLLAGAVAGIFLAVAVAFALDILNPKIKTVKEIERRLGYPMLGLIPFFMPPERESLIGRNLTGSSNTADSPMPSISPRVVAFSHEPKFAYEAYQRLHTSLRLVNFQQIPRVLVVTSTSPSEGKSEMSANLAATMAQSGRRVLLIDADLRAPTQHKTWNLENRVGTTHILSGAATLEDCRSSITPNLDVITSGVVMADPLLLLEGAQVAALVQVASQQYDYVIFDAPPAVLVPDALMLGRSCEGVLLAVRPKYVDVTGLMAAKQLLVKAKLPVLGFVATQVEFAEFERTLTPLVGEYGAYGYGYGYSQSS
jgi:succinoglycan biosynthesis transport protein ExoP